MDKAQDSDVVVSTPFGEIPWCKVSRFDDAEVKELMIETVRKAYDFTRDLLDEGKGGEILLRLASHDSLPLWEDPE